MRVLFSSHFLKQFLNVDIDSKEVFSLLTQQGFEVESVLRRGAGLDKVVLGRVVKVDAHPQAQKLRVCEVDCGASWGMKQIVCGAPNVQVGLGVAVALPGAVLPGNKVIAEAALRGVMSSGMLCGRSELGLEERAGDEQGLWEITLGDEDQTSVLLWGSGDPKPRAQATQLGMPVFQALGIDDLLFEVGITPNRADVLSHGGLAREVVAGLRFRGRRDVQMLTPEWLSWHPTLEKVIQKAASTWSPQMPCRVVSPLGIPGFFILLNDLCVGETPFWLRDLLERLGCASINRVVDAGNVISLAWGQPQHFFDYDKVKALSNCGKDACQISFRSAVAGESFLGLDGKNRSLFGDDYVVAAGSKVLALLGVLGGDESKVTAETRATLLEFAFLNPADVRRTSRRHGKKTDSSFLFEKGIDSCFRTAAAASLLALLVRLGALPPEQCDAAVIFGATFSGDAESAAVVPVGGNGGRDSDGILLREADCREILGTEVLPFSGQCALLGDLGFAFLPSAQESGAALVLVPSWRRRDVTTTACLVEEVVRIVGMDAVEPIPLNGAMALARDDDHFQTLSAVADAATQCGYTEVAGLHFMGAHDAARLGGTAGIAQFGEPVWVLNPLSQDEPILQTSLLPDLFRKVSYNLRYGTELGQLFHVSRTFVDRKKPQSVGLYEYDGDRAHSYVRPGAAAAVPERPAETPRLAGVLFGPRFAKDWSRQRPEDWRLHDVIAHCLFLAGAGGLKGAACPVVRPLPVDHPWAPALHPHRRAHLVLESGDNSIPLGWVGQLLPRFCEQWEVSSPLLCFELNLAVLHRAAQDARRADGAGGAKRLWPLKRFPLMRRDFAFIVEKNVAAGDACLLARHTLEALGERLKVRCENVTVFDVYEGAHLPPHKKSLGIQVCFEPVERTLTDGELQELQEAMAQAFLQKWGATLRG